MQTMKVRDVMTCPAVTVSPETPFTGIAATLLENDISGVPVVDENRRLVGVVSETDLVGRQVFGYRHRPMRRLVADLLHSRDPEWARPVGGLTAGELMTRDADTAGPDEDLAVAARRMLKGGHRRLAVVTDGEVIGVVSRHDLLRPFTRPDADIVADLRRLLADPFLVAEDHAVRPSVAAGVVTLDGTVRRPSEIEIVETEVATIPGVVAVDNRLRAREQEPLAPHLQQTW
jgi:CBS domain-containing protein